MRDSRRMKRMSRNKVGIPKMNLTSLMDVFTILVFFLLVNSGQSEILDTPKQVVLPESNIETRPHETVVIFVSPEEIIVQPQVLQDWFISKQITITFIPTPLLESLLSLEWPSYSTLRIVLTGGDKLHQYPSASLPFRVFNNYGPTENTVVTTSGLLVSSEETNLLPPIGRPIFNTQIYILDTFGMR